MPAAPNARPAAADAPPASISYSFSTTSCWLALCTSVTRPWAPTSTASARTVPGRCRIVESMPGRVPSRLRRSLSLTTKSTGIIDSISRIPPPRNTSLRPTAAPANPPMTGPMAPPSAIDDVSTPSAHPTRGLGVSAATSAVAAATVPLVAPCRNLRITSCRGVCAKNIRPTVIAPPTIERMSIGLRPSLSPSKPQMGLAMVIARPEALAAAAVHRSRSLPAETCRSCAMKIERKG